MQVCPRCHRANPSEAAFCYFDGVDLRAIPAANGHVRADGLPRSFAFPSGRRCASLTELAVGCLEEWDAARELLAGGNLAQYLVEIGRSDLARSAQATAPGQADAALDNLLQALPGTAELRPRLDLTPRRLQMGTLSVGEEKRVRLQVQNTGKGLLHGKLSVAQGGEWLRLEGVKDGDQLTIRTTTVQVVTLVVVTRGLSSPHKYSGKLTLVTNGGVAELPVRLDLGLYPFPKAPFLDVTTPRELADRIRTLPKQAVPLLESGVIANWFAQNGWQFPIQGRQAQGVAAVQQFFEGMGLSKAPVLQLDDPVINLHCQVNQKVPAQFTLRTDSKKWVFAHASCSSSWLRLLSEDVSGPQQTVVLFEVDSADMPAGKTYEADVKLVGNSGQTFTGRVRLTIAGDPVVNLPKVDRGPVPNWLVGATAAVVIRLAWAVPADVGARYFWGTGATAGHSPLEWGSYALDQGAFIRHFVLLTWWIGPLTGAVYSLRKGEGLHDLLRGILAGAAAGLACGASLACLLPVLDAPACWSWQVLLARFNLARFNFSPIFWLIGWIVVAVAIWALVGAILGALLGRAGSRASRLLSVVSETLSSCLLWLGLRSAAAYFVIR
jgi:hypothetical protein